MSDFSNFADPPDGGLYIPGEGSPRFVASRDEGTVFVMSTGRVFLIRGDRWGRELADDELTDHEKDLRGRV